MKVRLETEENQAKLALLGNLAIKEQRAPPVMLAEMDY